MKTLDRLLAAVFGIVLAAIGSLVAVELVAVLLGRGPALVPYHRWLSSVADYPWSSPEVRWVSAGLITAGIILAVLQLIPRRPGVLHTEFDVGGTEVAVDRSGLEGSLARAAIGVDGVQRARSRARRRRVRTTVDIPGGGDRDTTDAIKTALQGRLERFRVKPFPRLAINSRARGRSR